MTELDDGDWHMGLTAMQMMMTATSTWHNLVIHQSFGPRSSRWSKERRRTATRWALSVRFLPASVSSQSSPSGGLKQHLCRTPNQSITGNWSKTSTTRIFRKPQHHPPPIQIQTPPPLKNSCPASLRVAGRRQRSQTDALCGTAQSHAVYTPLIFLT